MIKARSLPRGDHERFAQNSDITGHRRFAALRDTTAPT
jgi:hypothetical protein